MTYWLVFVGTLATAVLLTPLSRWLSFRFEILAEPGGRRRHDGRIPKLGGVVVMGAFLAGFGLTYWLLPPAGDDARRLRGVLLGSLVMFIGGLLDDRYDLPPYAQLLVQVLGAAIAMSHIVFIEVFSNPFPVNWIWTSPPLSWFFRLDEGLVWMVRPLAWIFTLFWMLGMVNAVNMLDGLDGLAAGVGTIAALLFAWHSYRLEQVSVPLIPLALAGALLGFLLFNFSPAKIFLGSAGAYVLGFALATLSILSPAKLSTALLVLVAPILDVAWQIVARLRRGQNPLHGDRGHLHFRLSDGGLPTRQIVLSYYAVAVFFGLIPVFVDSPLAKVGLLLLLGTAVALLLRWLAQRADSLP
ncbi:MAG: glycosyltransferase family 4 protein [Anaerolineae bacterium]